MDQGGSTVLMNATANTLAMGLTPPPIVPGADISKRGITRGNDTWNNSLGFDVSDEILKLTVAGMHGVNDS